MSVRVSTEHIHTCIHPMKNIIYTKYMLCRKWNAFIIESFSLSSLQICKHPHKHPHWRMPFPCRKDIFLGACGFNSPQAGLFYKRWVLCWNKNTAMSSTLYTIFSSLKYTELRISIWSGSVGQGNGKHVAHKSLQNLGITVTSTKRHNCVCKQRHSRNSAVRNVNTQGF